MLQIEETTTNVILLPATIVHYERELTKYLEAERYEEAVRLLLFVIGCKGAPPDKAEEWQALLSWLQTMFPETVLALGRDPELEEEGSNETEEQFIKQYVSSRNGESSAYGLQLIELLYASSSPERQLMALEQLAFTELAGADESIKEWLSETETHPMVQFKALQTLKKRGCKGKAQFPKLGIDVEVDVEETPSDFEQFPEPIRDIIGRVEEISEVSQPDFPYFARQTWLEFLAYSYGTSVYRDIGCADRDGAVDAWAAGLHRLLLEAIFGEADLGELSDMYGITADVQPLWDNAYKELKRFGRIMLPASPGRP